MKKLITLALALIMLFSLAACGSPAQNTPGSEQTTSDNAKNETPATEADKPYDGTTITVVTTGSGPVYAAEKHLDEFKALTGITVNLEQYEFQEAVNKIAINAAAGGKDIDVLCYRPIQETIAWTNNGYFEPLNDYIAAVGDEYDYEDFSPAAREITTVNGQIVGIPYLVEGEIIWYNTEILEKYNCSVPTTMEELLEVAQKCYDPANNVYGLSLRGEGNGAVTQFSGFLYAYGGDFFDENKNATMNTPEALQALELYADLVATGPEGADVSTMNNTLDWFINGVTAMRIDAYTHTVSIVDPEKSLIVDKVGYAQFPEGPAGSTPYNIVAWAWGISSTSEKKDAAWEFVKWISSKDMDVQGMVEGGYSARTSTWENPIISGLHDPQMAEVVAKTSEVGKPYDRPFCSNAAEVRAIVGKMIDAANSGLRGDELKTVVEELNAEMQTILDTEK